MWVGPPRCVKSQFCTRTQESVSFFEKSNFPHNFFLNIVLRFDHHGRADGHVQCHALEVKLSWQDHVEKKIRWRMATLSSARVRWSQICKWCGRTDDPQCNKMKKNKSKIMDFKTGRDAADPPLLLLRDDDSPILSISLLLLMLMMRCMSMTHSQMEILIKMARRGKEPWQ